MSSIQLIEKRYIVSSGGHTFTTFGVDLTSPHENFHSAILVSVPLNIKYNYIYILYYIAWFFLLILLYKLFKIRHSLISASSITLTVVGEWEMIIMLLSIMIIQCHIILSFKNVWTNGAHEIIIGTKL